MRSLQLPLTLAVVAVAFATTTPNLASGEDAVRQGSVSAEIAGLQDQLNSRLKARRPEEFAFIALVVQKVQQDELPLELVNTTFQWVLKNKKKERFPFFYFQTILRIRAAELGITI